MKQRIDWKPFIHLVKSVFHDDKKTGGRHHTDELVVVRSMFLQTWYNLSDPELEFQCHDRLSFRNFLGFPEKIHDFSTIWRIRDRLETAGVDTLIWDELQRRLDDKGFKVEKGAIQDVAFIFIQMPAACSDWECNPGHYTTIHGLRCLAACCIMESSFFVACIAGLFHATLIQVARTATVFLEFVLSNYIYSIRTF